MRIRLVMLIPIVMLVSMTCFGQSNTLFQAFQNPPVEARPFVRWWWNGDCVEEKEILRELDVMKKAGIGGVEINPIAMPDGVEQTADECLTWGSPEWAQMVKITVDGCKDRDMIADIIIGSGWPFGGEFLESGETVQAIGLNTIEINGPQIYKANINDLMHPPFTSQQFEGASPLKPMFLTLAPKRVASFESCIELIKKVQTDGTFEVRVPEGEHILFIGGWQEGFRRVMHGAPGSAGQVLDHYNRNAVQRYLDRFANALAPALGGKLGNGIRALFVDSIELSGANWTTGFAETFKDRYGYSIEPYLPFVIYRNGYAGFNEDYELEGDFKDMIYRVRYDYYKTIVDIFLERFTQTYHQWCHDQGCLSRYQAYGQPWLVGMLEGYLIPDIPESNGWLYSTNPYAHGYWVWNKYASSAAHFKNRPIISSETMTNTQGVFGTSLETIKQNNDMNFIMGINHDVLHGFNYSPPEADFPGWVRYGTYFSEQNSWWPYFKQWTDYTSRLSAVFQKASPSVEVAILHPAADIWSQAGLYRPPFHLLPWYSHRLWESFSQNGSGADYICEKVIQEAKIEKGVLQIGPMSYKTLILSDVRSIQPETAEVLRDFVDGGGRLIIIGDPPNRSPSFYQFAHADSVVQQSMHDILDSVKIIPSPQEGIDLLRWTTDMMEACQVDPTVMMDTPNPHIYQNHYQYGDQDIFFFVNHDQMETISFNVTFPTGNKLPWRWDAETGERWIFPFADFPNQLEITLAPLESILLVFENDLNGEPKMIHKMNHEHVQQIETVWDCDFYHVQKNPFSRTLDHLIDLSRSPDEALNTFAGTIVYKTTFECQNPELTMLDLGEVHNISEVILNGQNLGTKWWGNHIYDVAGVIQPGNNQLEIKVTTVLLNYVKSLKENATAQQWTAYQRPTSLGLVGPVALKLSESY